MRECGLMPPALAAALRLYPKVPGSWLLVDPWTDVGDDIDPEAALELLVWAIVAAHDGHNEALIKFLETTWRVLIGTFSASKDMIDVLKHYPSNETDWPKADTMIRAGWAARKGATYATDPELERTRHDWAGRFWRHNIELSDCLRPGDLTPSPSSTDDADNHAAVHESEEIDSTQAACLERVENAASRFLNSSACGPQGPDLWEPAKHEVISGLVMRAARAVVAWLRSPDMWSGEHGAGMIRLLTETEIVMT
jgi:hypothetical protein